jgi:hypothetical protein
MNKHLQQKLSATEELIAMQKEFVADGSPAPEYMHGMVNGMILVHAIIANIDTVFVEKSVKKRKQVKIRHKRVQKRSIK